MSIGDTSIAAPGPAPRAAPRATAGRQDAAERAAWLFHPLVDFLCLGGGSLIVMTLLLTMEPSRELMIGVAATALLLANVLNHPHFANSYQIFYRNFRRKLLGPDYGPVLRLRYFVAGLLVPAALIGFFAVSLQRGDARMLGLGGNLMLFLVGWHYVKQGYGMLIVDSVLKRRFFAPHEKKILLANAYACWILYWLLANWLVSEHALQGLTYYSFAVPAGLVYAAMAAAGATGAAALAVLARKCAKEGAKAPINGVVAYLVTLYLWVLFGRLDPLLLLLVPAFHSLQYLVVVWRFQLNYESSRADAAERPGEGRLARFAPPTAALRFAAFVTIGVALGYVGFWGAPQWLASLVPYDQDVFGASLYLFVFWIFINVHHYFLDNVMWRRENPDTGRYLFAHG
ncbi:MAG: hypothetical protein R3322_08990 [Kiloniellales bacterium]|nr:hypothetical protein [Kiloniellales bacterium]